MLEGKKKLNFCQFLLRSVPSQLCRESISGDFSASLLSLLRVWLQCGNGSIFVLINIYLFIYLFMAALDLHCCAWAFSSCDERGPLFVVVRGLLIAVASLVAEHGL